MTYDPDHPLQSIGAEIPPMPSPERPFSTLKFQPKDVFELVIAGTALARFDLTSNGRECFCCGAAGKDMSEAESHHPCCKVRRWWEAVNALKIGLEVRR